MVMKTAKYRVRSGNTLKASSSRYLKEYLKHSCIVKRIQNDNETEKKILDDPFDDFSVNTEGVVYSLNKKGRWSLPKLMEKEILSGNLHKENMVSLTQFHKLKRRANCVGFCSNKGKRKHIYSKRRMYFNKISALKSQDSSKSRIRRKDSGRHNRPLHNIDRNVTEIKAPEPEIQYEVFYPGPITSSVTHNPKYIKSTCASHKSEKESGDTKAEFKKKRHRHKLQLVDYLDDSCIDDIKEDLLTDTFDILPDSFDEEILMGDCFYSQRENNIISQLVDKALLAQQACVAFISNRHEKHRACQKSKSKATFTAFDLFDSRQMIDVEEIKAVDVNVNDQEKPSITEVPTLVNETQHVQHLPTRLIIPSICVTPEYLHAEFSQKYVEAATLPRKFLLDITAYSRERLKRCHSFDSCYLPAVDLNSYLSFTYDGSYDTGLDIFNVSLHMNLKMTSVQIETLNHLQDFTIDDIIKKTCDFLCTLPVDVFCQAEDREVTFHNQNKSYKCFEDLAAVNNWNTKVHLPATTERQVLNSFSSDLSYKDWSHDSRPEFCNICFDCIDATTSNSAPATALSSCSHWFCDNCWKEHLLTQIKRGSTKLSCPEYECNEKVDLATLITLVSLNVIRLFVRLHDVSQFEVDPDCLTKWCPNKFCGRMIKVRKSSVTQNKPINVECECGNEFCFTCFNPSHWPASCSNTSSYRERMKKNGDENIIPFDDVPVIVVRGKNCPKCGRFIEKQGGCTHMACICGHSFCWSCLHDYETHKWPSPQCFVPETVNTKKFAIHQVDAFSSNTNSTFYEKAIECRMLRHPYKLRRLRKHAKQLGLRLKEKCLKRDSSILEALSDFHPIGLHFQNSADKIPVFVDKMTTLAIELSHVLEHLAVVADQCNSSKERRKLGQLFFRFQDLVLNIHGLLLADHQQQSNKVVVSLLSLQQYSTSLLKVLVNSIR